MEKQTGGLSVILSQIDKEAQEAAAAVKAKAKAEADEIIADANKEAARIIDNAEVSAEKAYKSACRREENSIQHRMAQELLSEKQRLINNLIAESADKLKNIDKEQYFEFLIALTKKYVRNIPGTMLLSENDIHRMSKSFSDYIKRELPNLKTEASKRIDSGFIVKYDDIDIEENCTLDALVEENIDNIKEKVLKSLFR